MLWYLMADVVCGTSMRTLLVSRNHIQVHIPMRPCWLECFDLFWVGVVVNCVATIHTPSAIRQDSYGDTISSSWTQAKDDHARTSSGLCAESTTSEMLAFTL